MKRSRLLCLLAVTLIAFLVILWSRRHDLVARAIQARQPDLKYREVQISIWPPSITLNEAKLRRANKVLKVERLILTSETIQIHEFDLELDLRNRQETKKLSIESPKGQILVVGMGSLSVQLPDWQVQARVIGYSHLEERVDLGQVLVYQGHDDAHQFVGSSAPSGSRIYLKDRSLLINGFSGSLDGRDFTTSVATWQNGKAVVQDLTLKAGKQDTFKGEMSVDQLKYQGGEVRARDVLISGNQAFPNTILKNLTVDVSGWATKTLKVTEPFLAELDLRNLAIKSMPDCQVMASTLGLDKSTSPSQVSFTGQVVLDMAIKPKPRLEVRHSCKVTSCEWAERFRKIGTYRQLNRQTTTTTGPGHLEWINYQQVPHLVMALVALEDPGYWHHQGWSLEAYQNSLDLNIKAGRMVRGGSTITMQLAKNLWLDSTKSLERKAQEFLLTIALNQCLSKEEILSLYLNVVQWGPDQFGLYNGARHWFRKSPSALSAEEAFWLVSQLPAPSRATVPGVEDMKRMNRLIRMLAKNGRIQDVSSELEDQPTEGWEQQP